MVQLFKVRIRPFGVLTVSRVELGIFLSLVALLGGSCFYLCPSMRPPKGS